jgi:hypothetical protein
MNLVSLADELTWRIATVEQWLKEQANRDPACCAYRRIRAWGY